jgi:hypothetical protein
MGLLGLLGRKPLSHYYTWFLDYHPDWTLLCIQHITTLVPTHLPPTHVFLIISGINTFCHWCKVKAGNVYLTRLFCHFLAASYSLS